MTPRPNDRREVKCAQCGHVGYVDHDVPATARLRCTSCRRVTTVGQAAVLPPARRRRTPRAAAKVRRAIVHQILAEHIDAQLDDAIDDLFPRRGDDGGAS